MNDGHVNAYSNRNWANKDKDRKMKKMILFLH